jgi:hypothetical protein
MMALDPSTSSEEMESSGTISLPVSVLPLDVVRSAHNKLTGLKRARKRVNCVTRKARWIEPWLRSEHREPPEMSFLCDELFSDEERWCPEGGDRRIFND